MTRGRRRAGRAVASVVPILSAAAPVPRGVECAFHQRTIVIERRTTRENNKHHDDHHAGIIISSKTPDQASALISNYIPTDRARHVPLERSVPLVWYVQLFVLSSRPRAPPSPTC